MSGDASRQVRALYDKQSIRVYQAYSDEIADAALSRGTFVSPPFKRDRMTWIKPSFLWMMYRAGWGYKDLKQRRILAVDISHEGFQWCLDHSCSSDLGSSMNREEWQSLKNRMPVRIQWDPDRDLLLQPTSHRAIQLGLSGEAVERYISDWIVRISDVTPLAHNIFDIVKGGNLDAARQKLPLERLYSQGAQ